MPLHSLPAASPGIAIGVGAALLLAGRKLFWFFVAAVGFVGAMEFATQHFGGEHRDSILIASLVAGIIGAVLAVFVQKLAVSLAGAAAGAYLLNEYFRSMPTYPDLWWIFLIAAAIAGALLMAVAFRWALIIVTSLAGAHLIGQWLPLPRGWMAAAYAALLVIGIAVQSRRPRPASE
jgi:uncharacterized membrane protein YeaQ/YmgE (transglycosylase-associated protein family)